MGWCSLLSLQWAGCVLVVTNCCPSVPLRCVQWWGCCSLPMMVVLSVGDSTVTSSHICRTQTHDPFPQNLHLFVWVRVSTGTGVGCLGKPQGFPCHSLMLLPWGLLVYKLVEYGRISSVCSLLRILRILLGFYSKHCLDTWDKLLGELSSCLIGTWTNQTQTTHLIISLWYSKA